MEWSPFVSSFAGAVVGVISVVGIVLVLDWFADRREAKETRLRALTRPVLERDLENYLVQHFAELFPGWSIYDNPDASTARPITKSKPTGRQLKTKAGIIDILCKDAEGNFVVIELKRDKAPDRVLTQVARYMEWVNRNLEQPDQKVRGLIIARRVDEHLQHALPSNPNVEVWLYNWQLELGKWTEPDGRLRKFDVRKTTEA